MPMVVEVQNSGSPHTSSRQNPDRCFRSWRAISSAASMSAAALALSVYRFLFT